MKLILIVAGWTSLGLGIMGVFLPLLPTTPFILLSAYCFSKSSPSLHQWLLHQPRLGPIIRNWEHYGSISLQAKFMATVTIILGFSLSFWIIALGTLVKSVLIVVGTGVVSYIWTRPLPPQDVPFATPQSLHPPTD